MFWDKRVRIAFGAMLGVLSLLSRAQPVAANAAEIQYVCEGNERLSVRQGRDFAHVRFIDRTYRLSRNPSTLGKRYGSAEAALAIDGTFAVFVAGDRLQPGRCVEAGRSKSSN